MGSVQRGGLVKKNDNGTLERVDGTNTYIGSATLESGKVLTKRFRCQGFDEADVIGRWEKWQGKKGETPEKEVRMAEKKMECPFSGAECGSKCPIWSGASNACALKLGGIGLFNISAYLMNLDMSESIELLAMAIADQKPAPKPVAKPEPTAADGIEGYLDGKSFLAFVNLHSKSVYSPYKEFCEEKGFPCVSESSLTKVIEGRYPELKVERGNGGARFSAA